MSIPGVESARRRRVSHGRSAGSSFLIPLDTTRLSLSCYNKKLHNTPTGSSPSTASVLLNQEQLYSGRISGREDLPHVVVDGLSGPALAARKRLDEKLRTLSLSTSRPNTNESIQARTYLQRSIMGTCLNMPKEVGLLDIKRKIKIKEKRAHTSHGLVLEHQQDCPVCLDSFTSEKLQICLPCKHKFHSDCLIPWLQRHCLCPFCRAAIHVDEIGQYTLVRPIYQK